MIIITGSDNHSHCCCYCVKERFNIVEDADGVAELVSMQLNVGVLLVKANGQVALPHSMVAEAEEPAQALADFVGRLKVEPRCCSRPSRVYLGPSRAISGDLPPPGRAAAAQGVHRAGDRLDAGASGSHEPCGRHAAPARQRAPFLVLVGPARGGGRRGARSAGGLHGDGGGRPLFGPVQAVALDAAPLCELHAADAVRVRRRGADQGLLHAVDEHAEGDLSAVLDRAAAAGQRAPLPRHDAHHVRISFSCRHALTARVFLFLVGMTLTVSAQPHKQIMVQSGARVAAMPPPTKKEERVGAGFCLLGADRRDAVAQEAEQGPRGGGGGRGEGDVLHTCKLRMN